VSAVDRFPSPAVNVVLVGAVENAPLVRVQRHVFDIKIAQREQLRRVAFRRDGVEMVVCIFLACEDDAAAIRELQRLKRKQRQRIFHRITAVNSSEPSPL